MTSTVKRLGRSAVVALAAWCVTGCGYALAGRGNALPSSIKRIGVPTFTNQSHTPDLEQIITEAVRQELRSRGRYVVVPDATGVDAVLSGVVTALRTDVASFTEARQASRYLVTLAASVEFREQPANTVFWSNPSFRLSEEYDVPSGSGATDPTQLFQADRQALERLARTFARSLITSILEAM